MTSSIILNTNKAIKEEYDYSWSYNIEVIVHA